jgi:UDP:flavonoid glycosyltransferase YjiC (YdhE family)
MPEPTGRRLLFLAEAVTLAHVARAHVVAKAAAAQGHEVVFCAHPRYNALFGDEARGWRELRTIPVERFVAAIDRGRPIYDEHTLSRYVEADLHLLRAHAPDAVIGDFRLSLSVSARVCGVPYATLTNAYWSPYARIRYPVPDILLARILGPRLAQRLFDLARPAAFALHAVALNRVRKRYGLPPLPHDLRHTYTDADLTLYADIADIVPVGVLPDSHRFIGPLLWAPRTPLPDWWNDLPEGAPAVYVNLGSSGRPGLLPLLMDALGGLPVTALVGTAGLPPPRKVPPNALLAAYLPGDAAAARSLLVINNGGSPSCYQSLAAGRPVLGLPHNLDQFLNMSLVEKAGAGCLLRPESGIVEVRSALLRLLDRGAGCHTRARELQVRIASHHGPEAALRAIETLWQAR